MKTENKVPLKSGYLIFLWDRLEITDNSKIEKIFILIVFFASSIYGLTNVLSYSATEGPVLYYSGISILITWTVASPLLILRTYRHVLYFNEIGKINLKESIGGDIKVKFVLRKGRTRFVHLGRDKRHFELFVNKLEEFKLKSEFQPLLT